MFLDPLRRAHCLFLAALLSTAVPLSHAEVQCITFSTNDVSIPSVSVTSLSTHDEIPPNEITLGSGDTIKLNIEKWGGPHQATGEFNSEESYSSGSLKWDSNVQKVINETLRIDVTDLCTNFTAYPAKHNSQGGIQLNLSATHNSGEMVDIFLLGYLRGNKTLPYDIGFTSNLENAYLYFAKHAHEKFYKCDPADRKQSDGQSFICLHVQGNLKDDCTVNIPLSYTLDNTIYQPYALGAVFYSYTPAQTPAPEPSTAMLTLLALTALAMRRRRRLN
ncbi:MAG: PEP-CTERM sorting domain-containing protein [Akkermansia sp.]|nr:PEP-CTERM sorting domain-containing protein [Akkermansia sp.]